MTNEEIQYRNGMTSAIKSMFRHMDNLQQYIADSVDKIKRSTPKIKKSSTRIFFKGSLDILTQYKELS